MVGQDLSQRLDELGYEVCHLSRKENLHAKYPAYRWDVEEGFVDPRALDVDHIIHLAGESVASGRWSASRKKRIYDSRIKSTQLLAGAINEGKTNVKSFIGASAIGLYGADTGNQTVTEDSPSGHDFLATVVKDWEAATDQIVGIPVAKVRIGVVLSNEDGALPKMLLPIKFGVGAPLGSGKQYMSWIHIDDLVRIFIHILQNQLEGTFNAVAPHPETNTAFTKKVAEVLRRPLWMPNVPTFAMKALLGEMAGIVLGGSNVSCERIEKTGFDFHYRNLTPALKNLLS